MTDKEVYSTIMITATCVHCGAQLAEPARFSWSLTTPSANWVTASRCTCVLAAASDLPHIRIVVGHRLTVE